MSESKSSTRIDNNLISKVPQKKISTAYVSANNNYGLEEDIQTDDRYVSIGSNPSFGSNLTYRFGKNEHFLYCIAIIFGIKFSASDAHKVNTDYLAYKIIRNTRVQLGSLQEWNLSGETLLHLSLQQCISVEKRRKLLEMSGSAALAATNPELSNKLFYYIAHIPIYGSSLRKRSYSSVKPLPLHMIKADNLELNIQLANQEECVTVGGGGTIEIQTCNLYYQYGKVLNSDMLKKSIYKYPFTYTDSFRKPLSGVSGPYIVDVSGFRRAECTHIIWYVVSPADITANRTFEGQRDLVNIKWSFNGDDIRQENNRNRLALDLYDSDLPNEHGERLLSTTPDLVIQAPHRHTVNITAAAGIGTGVAATPDPGAVKQFYGYANINGYRKKYYNVLKLADILKDTQDNGVNNYVNGVDFSKQTLQLIFDARLNGQEGDGTAINLHGGRLYYTLCYNSIIQFDRDGMTQAL